MRRAHSLHPVIRLRAPLLGLKRPCFHFPRDLTGPLPRRAPSKRLASRIHLRRLLIRMEWPGTCFARCPVTLRTRLALVLTDGGRHPTSPSLEAPRSFPLTACRAIWTIAAITRLCPSKTRTRETISSQRIAPMLSVLLPLWGTRDRERRHEARTRAWLPTPILTSILLIRRSGCDRLLLVMKRLSF